jgi:hypothetical protein
MRSAKVPLAMNGLALNYSILSFAAEDAANPTPAASARACSANRRAVAPCSSARTAGTNLAHLAHVDRVDEEAVQGLVPRHFRDQLAPQRHLGQGDAADRGLRHRQDRRGLVAETGQNRKSQRRANSVLAVESGSAHTLPFRLASFDGRAEQEQSFACHLKWPTTATVVYIARHRILDALRR